MHGGDGFEEGYLLGADLYAVTGLAAVGQTASAHEDFEAFVASVGASGVGIEESHLADDGGADEVVCWGVLRAGFEAASATDAA